MKRLILIIIALLFFAIPVAKMPIPDNSEAYISYCKEFLKWECIYQAIAYVESKNNPKAIGVKGDGGIIQILPKGRGGYLDEANRLLKEDRFADNDRFCPEKSREIWDVVMKHRNPEKSLLKAIKLHNPRASKLYGIKVTKEYYKLLKSNIL